MKKILSFLFKSAKQPSQDKVDVPDVDDPAEQLDAAPSNIVKLDFRKSGKRPGVGLHVVYKDSGAVVSDKYFEERDN